MSEEIKTFEIEDLVHQHSILEFFSKHQNAEIIESTSKCRFIYDSTNVVNENSKEFIHSLILPNEGTFEIFYEKFEFIINIKEYKNIQNYITNYNHCSGSFAKTPYTFIIPKIFTIHVNASIYEELLQLIDDILNKKIVSSENTKLQIFHNKWNDTWKLYSTYERTEDSNNLYLPEGLYEEINTGIEKFIKNKERYARFNINYKFTYLLEGLPGMGKTTLVRKLANKYRRDLYILDLGKKDMSDDDIRSLLNSIPIDSFLLIEDFDSYYTHKKVENTKINFGTILNLFDGIMSPNVGIISFITANDAKLIEPKFIRPGRVDRVVHFGEMSKDQFDSACINNNLVPDEQLFNICRRSKLSMSSLMHVLFYGETTEERIELAKQLVSERNFDDSNLNYMYC